MEHPLKALFSPGSVAVIGASTTPGKAGYNFTRELLEGGFQGKAYPVNPKGGEIAGRRLYKSLDEVKEPVDLALIIVSRGAALAAVESCARHGVKVGVMYTAGFGEMGEEGRLLQERMIAAANQHGMRIVGPNCMGMFSAPERLNLTGEQIPAGDIALISQSGNIGFSLWYDGEHYLGEGFSRFVGFGNQADIAVHEYIDFCADDPASKVIALYLEGLRTGTGLEFIRSCRRAAAKKPVVIIKGGKTAAGGRAASSHTGSLAGQSALYSAAFRKAGIVEVERLDEIMPVAQALMRCPPLNTADIAVTGTGGGHMIVSTDAAEKNGFRLPPFSDEANSRINELLYDFAPKGNPFDQAGTFIDNLDIWGQTARVVLDEPQIGGMFTFGNIGGYMPDLITNGVDWTDGMKGLVEQKNRTGKPVVAFSLCARSDYDCNRVLREGGIPVFDSPDIAMRALRALRERGEFQSRGWEIPEAPEPVKTAPPSFAAAENRPDKNLTKPEVYAFLEGYGIHPAEYRLATTSAAAVAAAEAIGYPVAMKIVSPEIIHKSDFGGVKAGLKDADAVRAAYDSIMSSCMKKAPAAHLQGVLVTKMAKGVEMIAGLIRDPQFGPVLMVGLGGVFVEIMKDVRFCILPASKDELREEIRSLRAFPLLDGARGSEKADVESLVDLLYSMGQAALRHPEIAEMDLNPVFVSAGGAVAADARVILR